MVTISSYVERENKDGNKFYALNVQGGLEMVLSESSGRYYATAKQASITSTFDEQTCKGLVGKQLPGKISKVVCQSYDYTIRETGEVITLSHRWTYNPNEAALDDVVYEGQPVGSLNEF